VINISASDLEEDKKHGDEAMQFFSGWKEAKPSKDAVMNHVTMILVAKNFVMNPAMILVVKNHAIRTR